MSPATQSESDPRTAKVLIAELERFRAAPCPSCGRILCSHEALMSIVLGFKNAPFCLPCLAAQLDRDPQSVADLVVGYIQQRECFRTAWEWAAKSERVIPKRIPDCIQRRINSDMPEASAAPASTEDAAIAAAPASSNPEAEPEAAAEWDAGQMGCGELVLELRLRLQAMRAGEIMKLRALDPGAPEDLPAWCRLTGHRLARAKHPEYWIQRKE